jgi:DNA repair exonuclease SbcCD ATPase subunit
LNIRKLETTIKNVDQIVHIADIHIRPYKRHEEYLEVFERLYDSISKRASQNSLIVLAGDIVHAKTEMTPELIVMVSDLFSRLNAICSVILIPGNHDANLNNINRLDALSPIVDNLDLKNFYYLKHSGLYDFADLTFSHMSVFDKVSEYIKANEFQATFKIALFHGVVDDAINDLGYRLSKGEISKSIFEGFNLVLLGDIHKHQFLDENIAYPGSLIQQNHGESLNKGYLVWDLINKKSEFINVNNDYGYLTVEVKDKVIPQIDVPEKCRLRLQIYDANNEETNQIISQIRQQYKPTELTTNRIMTPLYVDSSSKSSQVDIHNIQELSYQNDLIRAYLTNNYKLESNIIEKVCEINTEMNSRIKIDDIIKNVRWKPISFKWSNMFSFGEDNIVNFENLKGVVGLFAPNATGKSALVDSLSFCIYDKASREFSPINILNNRKDNFDCELEFSILDKKYFISRSLKKDKKGSGIYKVNFYTFDKNGEKQSLNGEKRWDTNKIINSILGSFDDFILTTFSMQEKNANFINIGHAQRKDLIIQFMGLGIFDQLNEEAKEKYKDTVSVIKDLQKQDWDENISTLEDELENKKQQYEDAIKIYENFGDKENSIAQEISNLKQNIVKIEIDFDINILNKQLSKTTNTLIDEKNKLTTITNNVNKVQIKLSELRQQTMDYFNIDIETRYKEYQEFVEKYKHLSTDLEKLQLILSGKYDRVKKLGEVEYDPNCKYCVNNALVKDAIKTKDEIKKDEEQITVLQTEISTLASIIGSRADIEDNYKKYKQVNRDFEQQQKEFNELSNQLDKKNSYIISLEKEIQEIQENIKQYEESKIAIENNRSIQKQIDELESHKQEIKLLLEKSNHDKMKVYGDIQVVESNIKNAEQSKQKLEDYLISSEYYKYYLECVKRDGIPYNIISSIIPALENEVNNILNQIVDFTISIVPDEKNINMLIVYDQNRKWSLELGSGMEKFISSIALRVALTNISNLPRPNFLIIDEGWGTLDSDNLNSVSMLLDYLKTQFDFVLVISHIQTIKEVADTLIEIVRKDNYSFIST